MLGVGGQADEGVQTVYIAAYTVTRETSMSACMYKH